MNDLKTLKRLSGVTYNELTKIMLSLGVATTSNSNTFAMQASRNTIKLSSKDIVLIADYINNNNDKFSKRMNDAFLLAGYIQDAASGKQVIDEGFPDEVEKMEAPKPQPFDDPFEDWGL